MSDRRLSPPSATEPHDAEADAALRAALGGLPVPNTTPDLTVRAVAAARARAAAPWWRRGWAGLSVVAARPVPRLSLAAGALTAACVAGYVGVSRRPVAPARTVAVARPAPSPTPTLRAPDRPLRLTDAPARPPRVPSVPFMTSRPVVPVVPRMVRATPPLPDRPAALRTAPATTRPAASDDLAYLNPDANGDAFLRDWGRLPVPAAAALQASVDRTVRGGDSFVEVPFPRVAVGVLIGGGGETALPEAERRLMNEAVAAYRREKEIVDARLQRRVTLAAKRVSFADLCARLAQQTGVEIVAARAVADDKVTLFCKDRPARDLMRAVSTLFNFTWERTGDEATGFRYRLHQSMRARLQEEELRDRDRAAALLALDREMQEYKRFLGMTPEEAQRRADEMSPGREKDLLNRYAGVGWGPANLYFGLTEEQTGALRAGEELRFVPPAVREAGAGGRSAALPGDLAAPLLRSMDRLARVRVNPDGTLNVNMDVRGLSPEIRGRMPAPAAMPGMEGWAMLRVDEAEPGRMTLQGGTGVVVPAPPDGDGRPQMIRTGDEMAAGESPSAASPANASANRALADRPAMRRRVSLGLRRAATGRADTGSPTPERLTTADLLEAIHRATGEDVIGDYFTRLYDRDALPPDGEPLFDVLNRACDRTRLRWRSADDWLTFRSVAFFNERPKEVPNRLLERWAAARRADDHALPLDTLFEMAGTLTEAQLNGAAMAEGARLLYGLKEWDQLRSGNVRGSWRLAAGLTPRQRAAAVSGEGLPFRQLTLPQQEAFAREVFFDSAAPGATPENLSAAVLRIAYLPDPTAPQAPPPPPKSPATAPAGAPSSEPPALSPEMQEEMKARALAELKKQLPPDFPEKFAQEFAQKFSADFAPKFAGDFAPKIAAAFAAAFASKSDAEFAQKFAAGFSSAFRSTFAPTFAPAFRSAFPPAFKAQFSYRFRDDKGQESLMRRLPEGISVLPAPDKAPATKP